ncbi:MAG: ABC transporter substrate-binding protein [Alphaproteobacteria bacterium]
MKRFVMTLAAAAVALPTAALAKDTLTLAMTLEPAGLDPTTRAEAAIGQIVLYNVFETLTKINEDATVSPGLAKSWTLADDGKTYTFKLHEGVKFHDGTALDSGDVKFTFERSAAEDSANKRKKYFTNMASIETPDATTVVITLKEPRPTFLFNMGEANSVILAPESVETDATNPVGTGPFKFVKWTKGDSLVLEKNPDHRDAANVQLTKVTYKFINDASAQVAALVAGDLDYIPFFRAPEALGPFKDNPNLVITSGTTEGETILGINNKKPPLDNLKVRQAIAHAIDRQEIIDGAMFGIGTPIGSHFAPHNPDYVDLTGTYPYDPEKAKALLKEAGAEGSELVLRLPPVGYARNGGQILAQQLEKIGLKIRIENVEWAQWLDVVYKQKNYDLSIVSHVEPMDIGIYANPDYYFQYDSAEFRDIMSKADAALDPAERSKYLKMAQRKLADDAVNGYLFQLGKTTVAAKGLQGYWKNSPYFLNDLAAISWAN